MASTTPCYRFNSALVRTPAASVVNGLRNLDAGNPNYEHLLAQHGAYLTTLAAAGVAVSVLPALAAFPDAVFVEDPALVFSEGAILLRPGASSRRGEAAALLPELHRRFDTVVILPPGGHADGGDVLVTPDAVLIGISARTNPTGARALVDCLDQLGYHGKIVQTPTGCLHLKSDCALLDEETVLVTHRLADTGIFKRFRRIVPPRDEAPAANAVRVNDVVLVSSRYLRTIDRLETAGFRTVPVDTAEIEKIDAGLSCMSLRWFRN